MKIFWIALLSICVLAGPEDDKQYGQELTKLTNLFNQFPDGFPCNDDCSYNYKELVKELNAMKLQITSSNTDEIMGMAIGLMSAYDYTVNSFYDTITGKTTESIHHHDGASSSLPTSSSNSLLPQCTSQTFVLPIVDQKKSSALKEVFFYIKSSENPEEEFAHKNFMKVSKEAIIERQQFIATILSCQEFNPQEIKGKMVREFQEMDKPKKWHSFVANMHRAVKLREKGSKEKRSTREDLFNFVKSYPGKTDELTKRQGSRQIYMGLSNLPMQIQKIVVNTMHQYTGDAKDTNALMDEIKKQFDPSLKAELKEKVEKKLGQGAGIEKIEKECNKQINWAINNLKRRSLLIDDKSSSSSKKQKPLSENEDNEDLE